MVRSSSLLEQMAFQIVIESSIRFTVGSSSRVRLKVSGARKMIACTGVIGKVSERDKQGLMQRQTSGFPAPKGKVGLSIAFTRVDHSRIE